MSTYRSRVAISLTQREAEALLTMISNAEAGDMGELFAHDGRSLAAAERAARKTRDALYAAEARDKGRAALASTQETNRA